MRLKGLFLGLFLVLVGSAHADEYVSMKLTGSGLYSWGGEYVSPYQGQIGSDLITIFCLDLTKNTYVNQPYWYDITTPATGDSTAIRNYRASAVLAKLGLDPTNTADERGQISFAIWDIFAHSTVQAWSNFAHPVADLVAINKYVSDAFDIVDHSPNNIPCFMVYYPDPDHTPPVGASIASQRYIEIVPDGGMTLMLLGGALVGLETTRRKFRV